MNKENDLSWYPSPRYLLRKKLICRFLKLIDRGEGGKGSLLEIGFGAGDMLCCYAKHGMSVYGYDFSKLANEEAMKLLKTKGAENGKVRLLASEKEMYSREYDVVAACEVLEHIEDDDGYLRRWKELLNPNGYLILSVPSRMKKWNISDVWAGHYRRYERKELSDKLMNAGFNVLEFWSYPFPINIALDPLLAKEKKRGIDKYNEKNYKKEDMSKKSGIKRESGKMARLLSKDIFMEPWHWLQMLFVNTDLGSGYVILAKRG